MKEIIQQVMTEERALFESSQLFIQDCVFDKGESPLKRCNDLEIDNCLFRWKYPLWNSRNIMMQNCTLFEMARAGIWYSENLEIENTVIEAPKNFRRSKHITLRNVTLPNASETLWQCNDVKMENVTVKGDYFAMNTNNIEATHFTLIGNYSFDGCKNVTIRNAKLLSKDAFWNTENVTVYDSFISGEYLGWNAKNLTFINCTIESLQGLCYIENLVMEGCKLINTTDAFEYSTVDAEITNKVDSILNPSGGIIRAESIDKLIMQEKYIDPKKTQIVCEKIEKNLIKNRFNVV